ncbi:MAG: hypothetical protein HY077_07740 [Elusimicrobia bacterium]|nr:hypothetical protein [Elusimicrobiota bacterium]
MKKKLSPPLMAFVLTLASCLSCLAQTAAPRSGTAWSKEAPPPAPGKPPAGPANPEDGFSTVERSAVNDQLYKDGDGILEKICRAVKLNASANVVSRADIGALSLGVDRELLRLPSPSGKPPELALLEQVSLSPMLGHAETLVQEAGAALSLTLNVGMQGTSAVVRPLGTAKSCGEIGKVLDVFKPKFAYPFTPKRLAEMEDRELWSLPFVMQLGGTVSIGKAVAQALPISIYFGRSQRGEASMTLFKAAPDRLILRVHVDHAAIETAGGQVQYVQPVSLAGVGGQAVLAGLVRDAAARAITSYIQANLGFLWSDIHGKHEMLEFAVDPRDPAKLEELSRILNGDLAALKTMALHMGTLQVTDQSTLDAYDKLWKTHVNSEALQQIFAGLDEYNNAPETTNWYVPFFLTRVFTRSSGDDKITRLSDAKGEYHIYHSDKDPNNRYFNTVLGAGMMKLEHHDVQAVAYTPHQGAAEQPVAAFIDMKGFTNIADSSVRQRLDKLNAILRLTGAGRGADGEKVKLPVQDILGNPPPPPAPQTAPGPNNFLGSQTPQENAGSKGVMSLTLALNQRAVADIAAATTQAVLAAFVKASDREKRPLADWLLANGRVQKDGRIGYDRKAAPGDADETAGLISNPSKGGAAKDLAELSEKAAGLLADVAALKAASSPQDRAATFARIVGERGRSGLDYEQVMAVFVQLIDPLDLTGDFQIYVDPGIKGRPKAAAHYSLKEDRAENAIIKGVGKVKLRFASSGGRRCPITILRWRRTSRRFAGAPL